jgi:hypothetical protein
MDRFVTRLAGAALVGAGCLAWKSYFFAGSGHAFLICCVIVIIGISLLAAG